jgi:hypothetical protein
LAQVFTPCLLEGAFVVFVRGVGDADLFLELFGADFEEEEPTSVGRRTFGDFFLDFLYAWVARNNGSFPGMILFCIFTQQNK